MKELKSLELEKIHDFISKGLKEINNLQDDINIVNAKKKEMGDITKEKKNKMKKLKSKIEKLEQLLEEKKLKNKEK